MKNNKEDNSIEVFRLIKQLNKNDILKLAKMTCKEHSHSYLAHPRCAFKDKILIETKDNKLEIKEKIGFLDIETLSFDYKADMGILLTYCIKDLDGSLIENCITPSECQLKEDQDKRIMKDLVKDLKNGYTRLIGHFSTFFDLPFLRSRAVYYNLDFPIYKEIYHTDTFFILKSKFALKSKSLENACKFFNIPCKEHKFQFNIWYNAAKGNIENLNHVLLHNAEDVMSTELLWKRINNYVLSNKRSI